MQFQSIQLRREMRQNQNTIMLQLRQINARLWNQQAANLNRLCIHADSQAAIALRAFQKVNPGIGAGLPGVGIPRRLLPVLNVGDVVPAPFFPADWSVLGSWQHADINALSIILNDNFGITRKEPLHILRERLRHFLTS
uniref:Uncharacterized protein n=1 Tax=Globisporangium ultimum (strain ATCC 200006 / CBS 805.95 / DAOM BR144) TaxID=431595 RepID=K3X4M0_GLOUD